MATSQAAKKSLLDKNFLTPSSGISRNKGVLFPCKGGNITTDQQQLKKMNGHIYHWKLA